MLPIRDALTSIDDLTGRSTLTYLLVRQGRFLDVEQVATATAAKIAPAGNASTAQLSVYGGLRRRDRGRRGDCADYEVVFGPSNVVMRK